MLVRELAASLNLKLKLCSSSCEKGMRVSSVDKSEGPPKLWETEITMTSHFSPGWDPWVRSLSVQDLKAVSKKTKVLI